MRTRRGEKLEFSFNYINGLICFEIPDFVQGVMAKIGDGIGESTGNGWREKARIEHYFLHIRIMFEIMEILDVVERLDVIEVSVEVEALYRWELERENFVYGFL